MDQMGFHGWTDKVWVSWITGKRVTGMLRNCSITGIDIDMERRLGMRMTNMTWLKLAKKLDELLLPVAKLLVLAQLKTNWVVFDNIRYAMYDRLFYLYKKAGW